MNSKQNDMATEMRKRFAENQKKAKEDKMKKDKDFKMLIERLHMYFFNEL